jgi:glucose/arabinose dehydrogenase
MTIARRIISVGTLALVASALTAAAASLAHAGSAITVKRVKSGLDDPAAFTFLPKAKIVYLERTTGEIRILNVKTRFDRHFFKVPGVQGTDVDERGSLGVAVDPKWPDQPFLYVYATRQTHGHLRNQILRIRSKGGDAKGFSVIMSAPASSSPYHNGGRIAFGPDGKLYAIVGDGHDASNAQDLPKNLRGKILRLNGDGRRPADDPIASSKAFAYGIRNSFGFTFDPETGDLWETENGPSCNDEINIILAGENYGWGPSGDDLPCNDTNQDGPSPELPVWNYDSTIGITGDAFCDGCGLGFQGDLFFGACCDGGVLHRATLNPARDDITNVINVLTAPRGSIYSMETSPDGRIYFSDDRAIYRLARPA